MRDLKEVLAENRDKYIEQLKNLVAIDTHDLDTALTAVWKKRDRII